jgi:hypothetical protein
VAVLAERLDQHRGRGHQQIVVKHVTVNADQAVVADQVMTDTRSILGSPAGEPNVAAFETGQDREQLPVLPGGAPDAK